MLETTKSSSVFYHEMSFRLTICRLFSRYRLFQKKKEIYMDYMEIVPHHPRGFVVQEITNVEIVEYNC